MPLSKKKRRAKVGHRASEQLHLLTFLARARARNMKRPLRHSYYKGRGSGAALTWLVEEWELASRNKRESGRSGLRGRIFKDEQTRSKLSSFLVLPLPAPPEPGVISAPHTSIRARGSHPRPRSPRPALLRLNRQQKRKRNGERERREML